MRSEPVEKIKNQPAVEYKEEVLALTDGIKREHFVSHFETVANRQLNSALDYSIGAYQDARKIRTDKGCKKLKRLTYRTIAFVVGGIGEHKRFVTWTTNQLTDLVRERLEGQKICEKELKQAIDFLNKSVVGVDENGVVIKDAITMNGDPQHKFSHGEYAVFAFVILFGAALGYALYKRTSVGGKQSTRSEDDSGGYVSGDVRKGRRSYVVLDVSAKSIPDFNLNALDDTLSQNLARNYQNFGIFDSDPRASVEDLVENVQGDSLVLSFPVSGELAETIALKGIPTSKLVATAKAILDAARKNDLLVRRMTSTEAFKLKLTRRGSIP